MIDIKSMSLEDLQTLSEAILYEQEERKTARFNKLVSSVIDALKNLKEEFPYASFEIEAFNDDYESFGVDIMNYVHNISAENFSW